MDLTSHYRMVTAIFDSPIQETGEPTDERDPVEGGHMVATTFQVGPYEYKLWIRDQREGVYDITFQLWQIHLTGPALTRVVSQILKRNLTDQRAAEINNRHGLADDSRSFGELGMGGGLQVFGNVMSLVQDFVTKHHPEIITFSADSPKRAGLYRRLIQRFFPGKHVTERVERDDERPYKIYTYFSIFLRDPEE